MLCDRLMVGISRKLQTDPDFTLEKAKTRISIRQKAAVQDYQRELAAEQDRLQALAKSP